MECDYLLKSMALKIYVSGVRHISEITVIIYVKNTYSKWSFKKCWVVSVNDLRITCPSPLLVRILPGWLWVFSYDEDIHPVYRTLLVLMHKGSPKVSSISESWNVAIWPYMCLCDLKPNNKFISFSNLVLTELWKIQSRKYKSSQSC